MARVAPARRRSRSWLFLLLLLGVVGGLVLTPGSARQVEGVGSRVLEPVQAIVSELFGQLEVENRDLRNLLGLKQRSGTGELLPARVIARDPSPFVQAITLDRGTDDGVKEG